MCAPAKKISSFEQPVVQRLRVSVRGAVQGVGFRPFVYRLAEELGLFGWVNNSPAGVSIEAEGPRPALQSFLLRLEKEKPVNAFIQGLESSYLDPHGYCAFQILPSTEEGRKTAIALPDIATCAECLRELLDPSNRRYRYPFINCTHCGPRFSIIQALPYDRARTTMRAFTMCRLCLDEYENPSDRRFHAQPNACPECGPHLEVWDGSGKRLAEKDVALERTVQALRDGKIVALKGIGGFQLLVDAQAPAAIQRLRERKHRDDKPLAVMCPTLEEARKYVEVSPLEERVLKSAESPIVLLHRRSHALEGPVAPHNPNLGIMLPYSPLHHLLMAELGFPIVATSGNVSDEPICIFEQEAVAKLGGIADFFLVHNRPIARYIDDSVVRVMMDRELVLRRARGYAPMPVSTREDLPPLLAVGAHLKNTVAITTGRSVVLSPHIGDLQTAPAHDAFRQVIQDLEALYDVHPEAVACDLHPNYLSTQYAEKTGLPVIRVQHHYAHALSCMVENELKPPVLGVSWDGTGYGLDKSIWGGEFLRILPQGFERFATFRSFPLPGGEKAIEQPARCAIGLLYEMEGDNVWNRGDLAFLRLFSESERTIFKTMLKQQLNTPQTSSVGRLFDAVAALLALRQEASFEGQAAMDLEFMAEGYPTEEAYPVIIGASPLLVFDWEPMIRGILADVKAVHPVGRIAAKFHSTLVDVIVEIAKRSGEERIVLSGGCFQNRILTEQAVRRLREANLRPYWHQRVPPNDGGLAVGQVAAAVESRRDSLCV
ncbi:MAG: carbamoyltransferase HypF [Elusimicrobiota bacterium]|jgi:hydrogenase maturation protein HypF